ncbi:MAG TPA: hypothetical protein VIK53_18275 [Verrucomicrobiae bacterium]
MRKLFTFCPLLGAFVLLCFCNSCATQENKKAACLTAVENLPRGSVYGITYHCKDMVKCVNTLQQAGKSSALLALKEYVRKHAMPMEPLQDKKLMYVCRLLFINPKGWQQLGIGATVPETDDSIAKQFPLFPVAISDGTPFMLIDGHHIEGIGSESGARDVSQCEGFSIINAGLPTQGYKKAAQDLIQSELFQKLYKDPMAKDLMTQEILNQAE